MPEIHTMNRWIQLRQVWRNGRDEDLDRRVASADLKTTIVWQCAESLVWVALTQSVDHTVGERLDGL